MTKTRVVLSIGAAILLGGIVAIGAKPLLPNRATGGPTAPVKTARSMSAPGRTPGADSILAKPLHLERDGGGYASVDWDILSAFTYDSVGIPPAIRALGGEKIRLRGFMLPIAYGEKGPKTFVLLVNQMGCCFGVPPDVNACAFVSMGDGEAEYIPDIPIAVYGTLAVKEVYEDGNLAYIYSIKCDRIAKTFP